MVFCTRECASASAQAHYQRAGEHSPIAPSCLRHSMTEPKLHHYVPRLYLRNFVNSDGRLWVYDKHSQSTFAVSPEKIAAEQGFYTLPEFLQAGADRLEVERALASMESQVAPLLARILPAVRSGRAKDIVALSAEERILLTEFISSQYFRTREMREILAFLVGEIGSEISLASDEEKKALAFFMLGAAGVIEGMSESIHDGVWMFAKNPSATPLFTSDHPVCIKNGESTMWVKGLGPLENGSYVVFPLAPDVVLYCKERSRWEALRPLDCAISPVELNAGMVEHENAGQAFSSTRFIFSSVPSFDELQHFLPSLGTDMYARERTVESDAGLERTRKYLQVGKRSRQ